MQGTDAGVKQLALYLRYSTSMVEVIANSVADTLIDGLSFKIASTASYITSRRSCTVHPQGSNIFSSVAGTKLIKISLAGHDWLDPSAFRIMDDLTNTDTILNRRLCPIGGSESPGRWSDLGGHGYV